MPLRTTPHEMSTIDSTRIAARQAEDLRGLEAGLDRLQTDEDHRRVLAVLTFLRPSLRDSDRVEGRSPARR